MGRASIAVRALAAWWSRFLCRRSPLPALDQANFEACTPDLLSTSCGRRLEPQVLSWNGADVESAIGFHRQTALHPLTPLVNALNF